MGDNVWRQMLCLPIKLYMKKKIIIALGLVCLLAVILAGAYYFKNKKTASSVEPGLNRPAVKIEGNSILKQALNTRDSSACAKLADAATQAACRQAYLTQDAAVSGDLKKCDGSADPGQTASCRAQALFSLAIQNKDKKFCGQITSSDDKESCLKVLEGLGVK